MFELFFQETNLQDFCMLCMKMLWDVFFAMNVHLQPLLFQKNCMGPKINLTRAIPWSNMESKCQHLIILQTNFITA